MGRGGLETMLMNYYRNIDRNKVQFDFLVHRDFEADYDKEIEALGGRIYRIPKLNPFNRKYLDKLDQFFKEHQEYKIVHSHLDCMAGIPLKYAKKNGIPCRIAHSHNNNQSKDMKYFLKLFYKTKIRKHSTTLFACSESAGKWMFRTNEFKVLNNAIDAKEYLFDEQKREKTRNDFKIDRNELVLGHVGRFAPQKNHTFILDIFDEILKINPNSSLILVGEGELQEEIIEKAQNLKIESKIHFTGVRSDVSNILQAVDVFVFPSLFEGLGIANIEAQASGLPCLISERVPMECEMVKGLVTQINLDKGAKYWAEKTLEQSNYKRKNTYSDILKSGFDIQQNAIWLSNYYLENAKRALE